jgi:hypothetical protein
MNKLHTKLWKVFSEYIRLRDTKINGGYGRCYTCNAIKHWKNMDAGHYEKRQHMNLLYDERNVHAQCQKCNRFGGGMQSDYAIHLIKDYGEGILQELSKAKWIPKKYSDLELMGMIEDYKAKVKELKKLWK